MTSYEFKVEVVTPLFLSGADQSQAELRPPSLKGALRFWFRAMAGAILGSDLKSLKEKESKIFGSTEEASSFLLDIRDSEPTKKGWSNLVEGLQFQRDTAPVAGQRPPMPKQGLIYLGFSLHKAGERSERVCIPPGSTMQIILVSRTSTKTGDLNIPSACLWLLLFLGSLGSRSRRGFGALSILEAPNIQGLPSFEIVGNNATTVANFLESSLKQLKSAFTKELNLKTTNWQQPPSFSALAPNYFRLVVLGRQWPSWHDALGEIGWQLAEFRKSIPPKLLDLNRGTTPVSVQRPAFGLPLQFYDPKAKRTTWITAKDEDLKRRASPLFIRPLKLEDKKLLLLLGLFKAQFLPPQKDELIANQKSIGRVKDYQVLDNFLESMKKTYQGSEVKL